MPGAISRLHLQHMLLSTDVALAATGALATSWGAAVSVDADAIADADADAELCPPSLGLTGIAPPDGEGATASPGAAAGSASLSFFAGGGLAVFLPWPAAEAPRLGGIVWRTGSPGIVQKPTVMYSQGRSLEAKMATEMLGVPKLSRVATDESAHLPNQTGVFGYNKRAHEHSYARPTAYGTHVQPTAFTS